MRRCLNCKATKSHILDLMAGQALARRIADTSIIQSHMLYFCDRYQRLSEATTTNLSYPIGKQAKDEVWIKERIHVVNRKTNPKYRNINTNYGRSVNYKSIHQ